MKIPALVGALALGALLIALGAFGARWLAPVPAAAPVTAEAAAAPPAVAAKATTAVELESLRRLLALLDLPRRQQLLAAAEPFQRFVEQEARTLAVLAAARANGADTSPAVAALMARAADQALAEAYMTQVVRTNLDPGFPTDAQVREAYDKNPALFELPERVHLWQVFIPLAAEADDATVKEAWALAERLARELKAGKADFAVVASRHSAHEQSRLNGGYMGLIQRRELLPPVAEALDKLALGGISEPIATEAGLHIVRRGQSVPAEKLAFERVAATVRERLRQEAALKVREAALQKIAQEFPVPVPTEALENWRAELARDLAPAPATTAAPAPAQP